MCPVANMGGDPEMGDAPEVWMDGDTTWGCDGVDTGDVGIEVGDTSVFVGHDGAQ